MAGVRSRVNNILEATHTQVSTFNKKTNCQNKCKNLKLYSVPISTESVKNRIVFLIVQFKEMMFGLTLEDVRRLASDMFETKNTFLTNKRI